VVRVAPAVLVAPVALVVTEVVPEVLAVIRTFMVVGWWWWG